MTNHAVAVAESGRRHDVRFPGDTTSSPTRVERLIRKLADPYDKLHFAAGTTG